MLPIGCQLKNEYFGKLINTFEPPQESKFVIESPRSQSRIVTDVDCSGCNVVPAHRTAEIVSLGLTAEGLC